MYKQIFSICVVVFFLFFAPLYSIAQMNAGTEFKTTGISEVDSRLPILVERYNKTHEVRGYRIQIISSSKKDQAKKAKSRFASIHHNYKAHEIYQQPFFIIKVGDFLTKLEAVKFHKEIEDDFPGSFVLPDIIEPYQQYSRKLGD